MSGKTGNQRQNTTQWLSQQLVQEKSKIVALTLLALFGVSLCSSAASYYPLRLDDPKAVYLTKDKFPVHGDGVADDSDALQQAIDRVQETSQQGIVFVPEGHYRITRTIYVWPGVRIIGYGATRPVIVLGKNTPGFQQGVAYMVFFAGGRAGHEGAGQHRTQTRHASDQPFPGTVPPAMDVIDANPGTFYSAMSNIDFEIGAGNPAAV